MLIPIVCSPGQIPGPVPQHDDDYAAFRRYMDRKAQQRKARRRGPQPKPRRAKAGRTSAHKRRRAKSTPEIEWLRELVCPLVYGEKTPDGVRPRITKDTFVGLWNQDRPLPKLPNYRCLDHFAGRDTLYFFGNGRPADDYTLAMIDVDVLKCRGLGTPEGALAFTNRLKTLWPGLYFERSTNGKGVHAYLLVRKKGVAAKEVNKALKRLEKWLRAEAKRVRADIEQVEVKGTCPELALHHGFLQSVRYGQFAKLPREAHRFAEWQATTVLRHQELMGSRFDVAPDQPAQVPAPGMASNGKASLVSGSVSGRFIEDDELAAIPKYEGLYRAWVGGQDLKAGKWKVTAHDFAVAMVLLRHFHAEPNADGTLPCRRAAELWTSLYKVGDVQRPWNHHRWKAIRAFLSAKGHIDWTDNRYEYSQRADGEVRRGTACKWTITEGYALTLDRVASLATEQTGEPSFVDTRIRLLVPLQGKGKNLRPEPFPIRAEKERTHWFRASEALERLYAA
jgi:hypothetical protein